jgi:hypothetical protein
MRNTKWNCERHSCMSLRQFQPRFWGHQDIMWTMIQGIVIARGILSWLWLHWKFLDFPSSSLHCLIGIAVDLTQHGIWCTGHFHVCDKMHLLSGAHLLTGFLQASFQCWQDISLYTWIQSVGTCECPVFSSVFILAGSEQNKSWLLQSWCGGQWTWYIEDYTIWETRYPGRWSFHFCLFLLVHAHFNVDL